MAGLRETAADGRGLSGSTPGGLLLFKMREACPQAYKKIGALQ
jgi:hypothetical protein